MADYFLDTSFLIDLLNEYGDAIDIHRRTAGKQCTATICLYELAKLSSSINTKLFRDRLVLGLDEDSAVDAGKIYRELNNKGDLIGEIDIVISGIARSQGLTVITRDSDFEKINELETIIYE